MTTRSDASTERTPDVGGIAEVVARARRDFELLTGRRVDSVSAVRKHEQGWAVSFEVVELERVPDSTSVLGTYETVLDGQGALIEYERVCRYNRNQVSETDF